MKPKSSLVVATIMLAFAIGVSLLVSPFIANQDALNQQNELLESIEAVIDEVSAEQTATSPPQYEVMPETPPTPDPLIPLDDSVFPSGVVGIGIMTIDKIGLRLPIIEGVDEAELRIAPGRVPQTAVIGDVGNAVIAGHRNYTYGDMFNRLDELTLGDIIGYQARNGEIMRFEVFEIVVIEPNDQIAFIQPTEQSIITLYTCTPVRTATHRLLVRAIKI
jgi:sortase A